MMGRELMNLVGVNINWVAGGFFPAQEGRLRKKR